MFGAFISTLLTFLVSISTPTIVMPSRNTNSSICSALPSLVNPLRCMIFHGFHVFIHFSLILHFITFSLVSIAFSWISLISIHFSLISIDFIVFHSLFIDFALILIDFSLIGMTFRLMFHACSLIFHSFFNDAHLPEIACF